jgi:Zinc dependent phospholipase C
MPTSGTHITIVQRLALSSPLYEKLLGNSAADNTTPEGLRARFANLGAVGPDIFYALADYGADLQDLENFLMKVEGSFQCLGELMGKLDRYVSGVESVITLGIAKSLKQSFDLVAGVIREGEMALIVDAGTNLWPVFEPAREKDLPRENWYWADYLHYIRTGRFVQKLLEKSKVNPNLHAYALGYLTHYVTDVVGHPYVNQVVQAPWRLYWQRHHLVENFIDAYVWDRWHTSNPEPKPPSIEEQPLDSVTTKPNKMGTGAPFTFARLNDLINIGVPTLNDPVDKLVDTICQKINKGLFDIGVAEKIDAPIPNAADFTAWTKMMADALQEVYSDDRHPLNLEGSRSGLGNPRTNGFPLKEDVAAAYNTMRLVLKISTEEKIKEPQAPNIVDDIADIIQQIGNDINKDLKSIPPFPSINTSGSFSLDSLWDAIKKAAQWLGDVAKAVGKAVFDFLEGIVSIGGVIVSDFIKYVLYLLNKALFALYRQFRDVLVLAAYAIPFTEELAISMGGPFNTRSLWGSFGNPASAGYQYPIEEIKEQRAFIGSTYAPIIPPSSVTGATVEQPPVQWVAPYQAQIVAEFNTPTTPDDFIDAPLGLDDMFSTAGPERAVTTGDKFAHNSFANDPRNFGGALANCNKAIDLAEKGLLNSTMLPDYNLDGDRGYAWPCWDVANAAPKPDKNGHVDQNFEHISPIDPNPHPAHVDAVSVSG